MTFKVHFHQINSTIQNSSNTQHPNAIYTNRPLAVNSSRKRNRNRTSGQWLNKDVLALIFEELIDNKNSLRSVILVNRIWCGVGVPILWKDPWRNLHKLRSLLEVIVSFLTNETRDSMISRGLNLLIKPDKQPLFNYISFCRCLDLSKLERIVHTIRNIKEASKWSIIRDEIFKLFINENNRIMELIIPFEFKHQIQFLPGFDKCFSRLVFLQCDEGSGQGILDRLAEVCKSIKNLVIDSMSWSNDGIIKIIEAQTKLENVRFERYIRDISTSCGRALNKHANTIQHLQIHNIPGLTLSLFANLKSLEIISSGYDVSWRNLENLSLPVLQTFIGNKVPSCFLSRFIENSSGTLVKIKIHNVFKDEVYDKKLIWTIYKKCPNLKYLGLILIDYDWLNLENLLINCQYLNGLIIDISTSNYDKLFEILTKSAPKNLFKFKIIHRNYRHTIKFNSLMLFLNNWKVRHPMILYMDYVTTEQLNLIENYRKKGMVKKFYHVTYHDNYDFEWIN